MHPLSLTLSFGSFIAAPPYLTTIVLPRNLWRRGSASDSTVTFCKLESSEHCTHARISDGHGLGVHARRLMRGRGAHRLAATPPDGRHNT
jgi:hypothetical protein